MTATAVALDLGSCTTALWAARRGTVSTSCGDPHAAAGRVVRRGGIVDLAGSVALLSELVRRYAEPVPRGGVVVACRPVLASSVDQDLIRGALDAVLAPARVLFLDTVRAAAVGSGAAAGDLLVVDVGAELTEVALLRDAHVVAARRSDLGTRDLTRGATVDLIGDNIVRHVDGLRAGRHAAEVSAALRRGLLLVGGGALHPALRTSVSAALRVPVHRAASPRTAALRGAGLAAMSLLRHPAGT